MIGVLILREDSRCGIQRGCWRWGCELYLLFCHILKGILEMIRLSVPFTPPTKKYYSLEDVVKKVPNYEYQLYFANPESTKEIEAKVRGTTCLRWYTRANWLGMGTAGTVPTADLRDRIVAWDQYNDRWEHARSNCESWSHKAFNACAPINE